MEEFTKPEYWHALGMAILYGAEVLVGMIVAGGILTLASGGTAARNWKKSAAGH